MDEFERKITKELLAIESDVLGRANDLMNIGEDHESNMEKLDFVVEQVGRLREVSRQIKEYKNGFSYAQEIYTNEKLYPIIFQFLKVWSVAYPDVESFPVQGEYPINTDNYDYDYSIFLLYVEKLEQSLGNIQSDKMAGNISHRKRDHYKSSNNGIFKVWGGVFNDLLLYVGNESDRDWEIHASKR